MKSASYALLPRTPRMLALFVVAGQDCFMTSVACRRIRFVAKLSNASAPRSFYECSEHGTDRALRLRLWSVIKDGLSQIFLTLVCRKAFQRLCSAFLFRTQRARYGSRVALTKHANVSNAGEAKLSNACALRSSFARREHGMDRALR